VLSTLHTNDAASAINRLLDLGVNTSILTASLSMVVAQRLMRRVCPQCAEHAAPTPEEAAVFSRQGLTPPPALARAVGCESCYKSGYRGRIGIYEVLRTDRAIGELIFSGALHSTIEDAAVKAGTSLMYRQALKKATQGVTTLEEVFRVVADA
jgi:type IV pilus assembly protein PilB